MSIGDIFYIVSAVMFALMTFLFVRNNFRSKFDDEGKRKDCDDHGR